MSISNQDILRELRRMVANCTIKRELLLDSALAKSKQKKTLTIVSGALSLLSAGTITIVIIKYFGNEILQLIAALTAGVSGIISILLTVYFEEDDTSKIFEGSSKYLALRDKTYRFLIHPNTSNEQIFNELENLQTEYAQLDVLYSKFTPKLSFERTFSKRSNISADPLSYLFTYSGSMSNIPPIYSESGRDLNEVVRRSILNEMKKFNNEINSLNQEEQ